MPHPEQTSNEDLRKLLEEHTRLLNERLDGFEKKLNPISELYVNANTFGSWIKKILIFIALVLGLLLTYKQLRILS